MEKSRAIELLKLAVPIKALTQQEYADFVEAVNMGMDALEQPTFPDTIDRKAAIDRFNVIRPVDPKKDEYTKGIDVGIAMCIVAVKDQPTIQPEKVQLSKKSTTSDLISRAAAQTEVMMKCERYTMARESHGMGHVEWSSDLISVGDAMDVIRDLPTIQPEPKEGHWIEGGIYRDVIECNCSECGQLMTTAATVRMNFCPNCGAKMTISTK